MSERISVRAPTWKTLRDGTERLLIGNLEIGRLFVCGPDLVRWYAAETASGASPDLSSAKAALYTAAMQALGAREEVVKQATIADRDGIIMELAEQLHYQMERLDPTGASWEAEDEWAQRFYFHALKSVLDLHGDSVRKALSDHHERALPSPGICAGSPSCDGTPSGSVRPDEDDGA